MYVPPISSAPTTYMRPRFVRVYGAGTVSFLGGAISITTFSGTVIERSSVMSAATFTEVFTVAAAAAVWNSASSSSAVLTATPLYRVKLPPFSRSVPVQFQPSTLICALPRLSNVPATVIFARAQPYSVPLFVSVLPCGTVSVPLIMSKLQFEGIVRSSESVIDTPSIVASTSSTASALANRARISASVFTFHMSVTSFRSMPVRSVSKSPSAISNHRWRPSSEPEIVPRV